MPYHLNKVVGHILVLGMDLIEHDFQHVVLGIVSDAVDECISVLVFIPVNRVVVLGVGDGSLLG